MKMRIDYHAKFGDEPRQAMLALEKYVHKCGLDSKLLELVKMRASQINGCAYCLDMHSKDARALGETEQRLYALNAWRETPFYSERERAALEWTEAVTLGRLRRFLIRMFPETLCAIAAAWNRRTAQAAKAGLN